MSPSMNARRSRAKVASSPSARSTCSRCVAVAGMRVPKVLVAVNTRLPVSLRPQIILAGGLSPDNIRSAIEQVRPFAVDVSGGVEAAKGIKDHNKLKQFIEEVARADKS